MKKKQKQVTIIADYFEIISSQEHSGERIDWRRESMIRNRTEMNRSDKFYRDEKADFEDGLRMECGILESVKRDPWTDELHLYSFQVWYTYQIRVKYTYGNRSYEALEYYETERGRLPDDCKLQVTFCHDNPGNVLKISEYLEPVWKYLVREFLAFLRRQ